MKALSFILFFLIFGITSCELALDVNIPAEENKLVVNGLLNSDCVVSLMVTRSHGVLDPDREIYHWPIPVIENAHAVIIDEDGNATPLELDPLKSTYRSEFIPIIGKGYKIHVTAPGFEDVESTTMIPKEVQNLKGTTDESQMAIFQVPVELSFIDDPGSKNYYVLLLDLQLIREIEYPDPVSNVLVRREFENREIHPIKITDDSFFLVDTNCPHGNCEFKSSIQIYGYYPGVKDKVRIKEARVVVVNLNPDYYNYLSTGNLQNSSSGDPFAQPVQVFTNIQNGFGIFSSYSRTVYRVK